MSIGWHNPDRHLDPVAAQRLNELILLLEQDDPGEPDA